MPRQHGGADEPGMLALAWVSLFNPRKDVWIEHFRIQGGNITGLTPRGRATVRLLNMNAPHRVELREAWLGMR